MPTLSTGQQAQNMMLLFADVEPENVRHRSTTVGRVVRPLVMHSTGGENPMNEPCRRRAHSDRVRLSM